MCGGGGMVVAVGGEGYREMVVVVMMRTVVVMMRTVVIMTRVVVIMMTTGVISP